MSAHAEADRLRRMARNLMAAADRLDRLSGDSQALAGESLPGGAVYCRERREGQRGAQGPRVLLTPIEGRLLDSLLTRRGEVIARDELMSMVFGSQGEGVWSRTIDQHVLQLRGKLGRETVRTVHGHGYMVEV